MRMYISARYSAAFAPLLLISGCFANLSYLEQGEALNNAGSAGNSNLSGATNSGGNAGLGSAAGAPSGGAAVAGAPNVTHAGGTSGAVGTAGAGTPGAGTAGAGTAGASACVSKGAELCNAVDDNCNGTVDEGCPALSTVYAKDLGPVGDSIGGSAFSEDCAAGEALSGVSVAMGSWLSQIAGICAPLLVISDSAESSGYRVQLGATRTLAAHPPSASTAAEALTCPNNEVVVGLRLSQQYTDSTNKVAAIPRVWITCAKLVLSKSDTQLSVAWVGAEEIGPKSGSIADGTAWFEPASLAQGLVASGLVGMSGDWVDRVGFRSSTIAVGTR